MPDNIRVLVPDPNSAATAQYALAAKAPLPFYAIHSVLDALSDPPSVPVTGDRYIVYENPTGAWVTHEDEIAEWNGATWDFFDPETMHNETPGKDYMLLVVIDESETEDRRLRFYSSGATTGTKWDSFGGLDNEAFPWLLTDTIAFNPHDAISASGSASLEDVRRDRPIPITRLPDCVDGNREVQPLTRRLSNYNGFAFEARIGTTPSDFNIAGAKFSGASGGNIGLWLDEPVSTVPDPTNVGGVRTAALHVRAIEIAITSDVNLKSDPTVWPGTTSPIPGMVNTGGLRLFAWDYNQAVGPDPIIRWQTPRLHNLGEILAVASHFTFTADAFTAKWDILFDLRKLGLKIGTGPNPQLSGLDGSIVGGFGVGEGGRIGVQLLTGTSDFTELLTQQFVVHCYLDQKLYGGTF